MNQVRISDNIKKICHFFNMKNATWYCKKKKKGGRVSLYWQTKPTAPSFKPRL